MSFEYGVYNPSTGVINRAKTLDEARDLFVDTAFDYVMEYFHHQPWILIKLNQDGSETWGSMNEGFDVSATDAENIKTLKDLFKTKMSQNVPLYNETPPAVDKTEEPNIVAI